jgi:hypothetical protein
LLATDPSFRFYSRGLTDKVHTRQLLQTLEQTSGEETLAQSSFEAFDVGGLPEAHLVKMVSLYFVELFDDRRVVRWQTAEFSQ